MGAVSVRGSIAALVLSLAAAAVPLKSSALQVFVDGPSSVSPNTSFPVQLSLDALQGLEVAEIYFGFDSTQLVLQSVSLAAGVPTPFLPPLLGTEAPGGRPKFGFLYLAPLTLGGPAPIVDATFQTLASASGQTTIHFQFDWNGGAADAASGGITVNQSLPLTILAVPEPSAWALFVAGGLLMLVLARRRSRTLAYAARE